VNKLILGDGLLGSELVKQTDWDCISRSKNGFNICSTGDFISYFDRYDMIVNCIANTNTYSTDRTEHWNVNYRFVYELAKFCNTHGIKLVHIGTDYLYAGNDKHEPTEDDVPVHGEYWYSYTKLLGDGIIQLISDDYLICRCAHKSYPFLYEKAFVDRISNVDYTHNISKLIIELIQKNAGGVYNVGTKSKSMYELVYPDNNDIGRAFTPSGYPLDTSMSIDKLNKFLK